jgi:MFS superfamily sulfate permease-like transporter
VIHDVILVAVAVAVGVTVATGLIVGVLVVVLRWKRRSAQGNSAVGKTETQQEMEWDNSALNITINPLDVEVNGTQSNIRV